MSLLLRRRAILQNGGRAKGGIGDGIITTIKTGSNPMINWTSYDVGQTFHAGEENLAYVQMDLVPDSWISRTEQRVQWNSGSTILNGPVYIAGPSGSTGNSWSRLVIRGFAGSTRPTKIADLAYLKLRFSGSTAVLPQTSNTMCRPANVVSSPGANKIVYFMPTASIICNLKDWIDSTYPNNDCRTSVEFLRKETARLIVEGTGTTSRAISATASCLKSPVKYNANGGDIIALHVTNSYTSVYAASGKPQFSKDDNLTYGILMTSAYWKGSMTAISPRFLITTDGCNNWYTLEQKMASSQSLGAITGSNCFISADGKNSAFFVRSYGGQPGVILGKNYFQEFEFKPISSLNFPISISQFIDQAAASDDLKIVYVADVSSSVFVSRDGMKSWELIYSGSIYNAVTAYTQLVCNSTGEYAQFLIHPNGTGNAMRKVTFSDFGRQYTINTQSLKFDRQNFMYRSTGQYDDVEAYKEAQDILAISSSISDLFFNKKGNPAIVTMKSGELINLPVVTKQPGYSDSWSYATGSEGTTIAIAMAPGYTPPAWGVGLNGVSASMVSLEYVARWLYTTGSVKSIFVEGEDTPSQYSMSRAEIISKAFTLISQSYRNDARAGTRVIMRAGTSFNVSTNVSYSYSSDAKYQGNDGWIVRNLWTENYASSNGFDLYWADDPEDDQDVDYFYYKYKILGERYTGSLSGDSWSDMASESFLDMATTIADELISQGTPAYFDYS